MRAPVQGRDTNPVAAAPRTPEDRRQDWRPSTRVLFAFDPWRGGFELSVEQRGHGGGCDDQNGDGTVRWRTVTGPGGTPVVCQAEHVARGAGSTAYILHASDAGIDVPRPLVRHVDGMVIARARRVPEGELVMVDLCGGLVAVAGVWAERAGRRRALHVSTLQVLTGPLPSVHIDVRIEDRR
jgi:hypothetical protein